MHHVFDQVRLRTPADVTPLRCSGDGSRASSATPPVSDETRSTVYAMARAGAAQCDSHAPSPQPGDESRMQQARDRWQDQQSILAGEDGRAELVAAQLSSSMFALPDGSNAPRGMMSAHSVVTGNI